MPRTTAKKPAEIFQFRVSLQDVEPEIWRRIQVAGASSFWDLHVAIQDAMGWDDSHLHEFRLVDPKTKKEERIGIPDEDDDPDLPTQPGWETPLAAYFSRAHPAAEYLYDFGDDWQHRVVLEDVLPVETGAQYPRCLAGARACPPEECGGPPGYEDLLAALADPNHESHEELREQYGDDFDPERFRSEDVIFDDPRQRFDLAFSEDEEDDGDDEDNGDGPDPKALRATFREVVRNHLRDGELPEVRQTHDRLLAAGFPKGEVMDMLCAVVATEMFEIVRDERAFDRERYVRRMLALPKLPYE